MNEIVFRHGDKIPVLGTPYTLIIGDSAEIAFAGGDNTGACKEGEAIYVSPNSDDPGGDFAHELTHATKYEILRTLKGLIEDVMYKGKGG